jgi:hypothetical protein
MRKYEKFNFNDVIDYRVMPSLNNSTLDCKCHQCGAITRTLVEEDFIDWKKVSDDYQNAYNEMTKMFELLLIEASNVFNVPIIEWVETKRTHLIAQLEDALEKGSE